MSVIKELISSSFNLLQSEKIINDISYNRIFNDEPPYYYYGALLNYVNKFSDGIGPRADELSATGISFESRQLALIRFLGETMERYSQFCYKKDYFTFSSFNDFQSEVLDPYLYKKNKSIRNIRYGWINGYDLVESKKVLIPGQLVYLNYPYLRDETILSYPISTGAAGGFNHESTLLRGIYEIVERDALMTIYLNKISVPKIQIQSLNSVLLNKIIKLIEKYHIEPFLFNITNDIGIPSFLAVIIDRTKLGPPVSFGIKAGLRYEKVIVGAIEEAFLCRQWARHTLINKKEMSNKEREENPRLFRAIYWSTIDKLNKLDFLLKQKTSVFNMKKLRFETAKDELKYVVGQISQKDFKMFFTDITLDIFKKINYMVYKVLIPGMQPLYLNERHKELVSERLQTVSEYFNKKKLIINKVPHPFL